MDFASFTVINFGRLTNINAHRNDRTFFYNHAFNNFRTCANVKAALINVCKEETAKGKKLTTAEVSKYCTCAVEADGKLTNAQKWEIQSAINQKKSPATLAFVQKQNKDLQACFGPQLTGKLKTLTEEAMKAGEKK